MNIPKPLYSCSDPTCAEETSYQADMLRWSNEGNGWFCLWCETEVGVTRSDWSLADELESRRSDQACCDGGGEGCASPDCWKRRLLKREREVSAGA